VIDAAFKAAGEFTVAFHEGRHFLNGVEESLLQVQLPLKSITL